MPNPLITIITPTVQRETLLPCCRSVEYQTFPHWEHIVQLDLPEMDEKIFAKIDHPRRFVFQCPTPHRNGGNTCRHLAWTQARGKWIYYLDDDNFLATFTTLEELAPALSSLTEEEKWALVPIHRHGSVFYHDPPRPCFFDTGNAICRREIAQWPDIPDYASDAVWLGSLLNHPFRSFPFLNPVMVMPFTNFGSGGGINGQ